MRLDEEDLCILCALAASPSILISQNEIEAASEVSRKTISNRMPALISAGLVSRKGQRGGYAITKQELDKLRSIPLTEKAKTILQGTKDGSKLLQEIDKSCQGR
jgi:predicted transcriptional regulator